MTYLLEKSAAQNQSVAWLFYVNSEEFSTCHNKMDSASSYCFRECWAQREKKQSELG